MGAQESISFDKVAAIYDETRGGLQRGENFVSVLATHCGPGRVFEIGVGTGAIARPLTERLGWPVLGADLSPEMLRFAQKRLGTRVAVADVARLPVATGALGTVIASWVLHLVGDPAGTVREAHRALAPDGRLVVVSSRGEYEPDDMDAVAVDLQDVLRGRVDTTDRLVPMVTGRGFALAAEATTAPITLEQAPLELVERMERRQWGVLIDLDQARYDEYVQPVVDALRALPEPDRPRRRVCRHRVFVFAKV